MPGSKQPETRNPSPSGGVAAWGFLTNHAYVLLTIADDPSARLRDMAERTGITERSAQRIVNDLVATGYIEVTRQGRRNIYKVNSELPLRHPLERDTNVGSLLDLLQQ